MIKKEWVNFRNRFIYALNGIIAAFRQERNLQIQGFVACLVLLFSFIIHVPLYDFIIILCLIGIVLSLELINTAIESVVDLVTERYHPLAKLAKDVAAGAVLLFSIISVIIGLIIFIQTLFFK